MIFCFYAPAMLENCCAQGLSLAIALSYSLMLLNLIIFNRSCYGTH